MSRRHTAHFAEFEPHTRLKHRLLRNYLSAWVPKLAMDGRRHTKLHLIDAFAGEGSDRVGRPGSPLIMIDAAVAGIGAVRQYKTPPEIGITLIEKKPSRLRRLNAQLNAYDSDARNMVTVLRGQLSDYADRILEEVGDSPMLAFFDPYGMSGLSADLILRALAGPQHEVLVLVNGKAAERLAHAVAAPAPKSLEKIRARLAQGNLFMSLESHAAQCEAEIARARDGLANAERGAREHLSKAFGMQDRVDTPEWAEFVTSLTRGPRADVEAVNVFAEILSAGDAPLITRMPVYSTNCQLKYILVHATKHTVGRQTIKEAFYSAVNNSDLPDEAKHCTVQDMLTSEDHLRDAVNSFAGKSVPWAKNRPNSLQDYLLQRTDVFPWQLRELEKVLKQEGLREPGRIQLFKIPHAGWRATAGN